MVPLGQVRLSSWAGLLTLCSLDLKWRVCGGRPRQELRGVEPVFGSFIVAGAIPYLR